MRSLLNKVFTPRANSSAVGHGHCQSREYLSRLDPNGFDAVQEFTAPFPVEVITTIWVFQKIRHKQVRHWIDEGLHREIGQSRSARRECRRTSIIDVLPGTGAEAPSTAARRPVHQAHRSRSRAGGWRLRQLDDLEIAAFASLLGGAGAETVTKLVGNAVYLFGRTRTSGGSCRRTAAKSRPPSRNCSATRRPPSTMCAATCATCTCTAPRSRRQPGVLDRWVGQPRSAGMDRSRQVDIDRDRTEATNLGLGYGIHSCLGAALARMESVIALEKLLEFMPRFEVDFDNCKRVTDAECRRLEHVPVKVLRR